MSGKLFITDSRSCALNASCLVLSHLGVADPVRWLRSVDSDVECAGDVARTVSFEFVIDGMPDKRILVQVFVQKELDFWLVGSGDLFCRKELGQLSSWVGYFTAFHNNAVGHKIAVKGKLPFTALNTPTYKVFSGS